MTISYTVLYHFDHQGLRR